MRAPNRGQQTMVSKIQAYLDHKAVATNLSAYIDGALAPQDRERVERHLAVCPECQRNLATLRQTVSLLRRIPVKRVPRPFTLPMSAQAERTAHRRWALANSFMRVSAAAVSFMLLLLLSTDAVLRFGAIPIPDVAPRAEKYVAPRAGEVEAAPQVISTKEVEAAPLEPTAEELVKEPPAAEHVTVAEPSPLVEGMGGVGGGTAGTPEQEVSAAKALPAPSQPMSTESANGSRGVMVARKASETTPTTPVPAPAAAAVETPAEGSAGKGGGQPTQDSATSPTAEVLSAEATSAPRQAVVPTAEPEEPAFVAEGEPPQGAPAPSPLWRLWRTVRLLAGLLAGLLCVLFAGLLWTSRKRRV